MIANAVFVATLIFLALGFGLMSQMHYLRSRGGELVSFEIILPFLKSIQHLLAAETVSEIMVNPDSSVWIEEDGQIQLLSGIRFEAVKRSPHRPRSFS